jgi:hypothetical protein
MSVKFPNIHISPDWRTRMLCCRLQTCCVPLKVQTKLSYFRSGQGLKIVSPHFAVEHSKKELCACLIVACIHDVLDVEADVSLGRGRCQCLAIKLLLKKRVFSSCGPPYDLFHGSSFIFHLLGDAGQDGQVTPARISRPCPGRRQRTWIRDHSAPSASASHATAL